MWMWSFMYMIPSFKAAAQKALGKPVIVADRFHFCRYIYWALDGVKRRIQSEWNDYDRKKCKRMALCVLQRQCKANRKGTLVFGQVPWDGRRTSQGLRVERVLLPLVNVCLNSNKSKPRMTPVRLINATLRIFIIDIYIVLVKT